MDPVRRLAHFVRAVSALHTATTTIKPVLETDYADWGMDTSDADEALDEAATSITTTGNQNSINFELDFEVNTALAEDQQESICNSIYDHYTESDFVTGDMTCTLNTAKKRQTTVSYVATITYTEGMLRHYYLSLLLHHCSHPSNVTPLSLVVSLSP
jgi:hypothetical protein